MEVLGAGLLAHSTIKTDNFLEGFGGAAIIIISAFAGFVASEYESSSPQEK